MINIVDLSAIDKLIDFHGPNCSVKFDNFTMNLYDLRDHCELNNIPMNLNYYDVKPDGIYSDNLQIVKVLNTNKYLRDDLTDI